MPILLACGAVACVVFGGDDLNLSSFLPSPRLSCGQTWARDGVELRLELLGLADGVELPASQCRRRKLPPVQLLSKATHAPTAF